MNFFQAIIAASSNTSAAILLFGLRAVGIFIPSAFTGTTITFTVSSDGVTYVALYDSTGTQVSVTVSTSRYIYFDPVIFAGIAYLKIVSGSTEGTERTLIVAALNLN